MVVASAISVFLIVTRGSYKVIERVFFAFCFVYISYVISGIIVHPHWNDVVRADDFSALLRVEGVFLNDHRRYRHDDLTLDAVLHPDCRG